MRSKSLKSSYPSSATQGRNSPFSERTHLSRRDYNVAIGAAGGAEGDDGDDSLAGGLAASSPSPGNFMAVQAEDRRPIHV